jgi:RecD/TraA family predicted helicase
VSILTGLGGTGKTKLLSAVTKLFRNAGMRLEQCALSGRASSKMSEVTKLPGKTIHRLLNYLPDEERFLYNADNWIPTDVIILDETSMVGGELFLQLIEAIPTGARFIMVGDHHQLEAIGLANVFKDCLSSGGYIPSSVLTKIHRQAAKSGIITESIRASNGERMLKDDFIGEETRGELQDFKIISSLDPSFTQRNILQEYRRLLAEGIDPNDIQIIVSQRTRGMISCRALNEAVQEIVNPGVGPGDIKVPYVDNGVRYFVTYKKGDKIIITKNNYHAKRPNQAKKKGDVQIFNGNVGYIEEINSEYMVVKLTEQGLVQIDRADWGDVSLAYAITCHKKQGDQVPYAIVGLDTSSYAMFSKEWVYTAITRASKYCAFVTTPLSINRAVKISRVKKKQTWLKAFLAQLRTAEITGKEIK